MSEVSVAGSESSLRKDGVIAERLRSAKRTATANALGKSDSWVDKVLNGECGVMLSDVQALMDVLHLKPVDKNKVCVDKEIYMSLKSIAGAALEAPQKLEWE